MQFSNLYIHIKKIKLKFQLMFGISRDCSKRFLRHFLFQWHRIAEANYFAFFSVNYLLSPFLAIKYENKVSGHWKETGLTIVVSNFWELIASMFAQILFGRGAIKNKAALKKHTSLFCSFLFSDFLFFLCVCVSTYIFFWGTLIEKYREGTKPVLKSAIY